MLEILAIWLGSLEECLENRNYWSVQKQKKRGFSASFFKYDFQNLSNLDAKNFTFFIHFDHFMLPKRF